MKIYNRYIISSLLVPVLVITLALTGIVWLTQSLRFIDLIVNRGLDVSTFLYLSSLLIPSLIMIIMPVALFCSVLFIYNRFNSDSELIVLKSAGLSRLSLAKPAIIVAFLFITVSYTISFYFLPLSYNKFKDTQAFIKDNYASVLLQEGVFNSPTKGLTVYIESRNKAGMLRGIIVHDSRNSKQPVTMMAQQGKIVNTKIGPRFDLIKGTRQQRDSETGNVSLLYFDSYPMDLSVYVNEKRKRRREPEERYLHELFFPEDGLSDDFKNRLIAESHHRIIWPLNTLVLTLVALSVLFTGQFNRRGQWKRIVGATIIAIIIVGSDLGIKSAVSSNTSLVFLMYFNICVIITICLSVLMRGAFLPALIKNKNAG